MSPAIHRTPRLRHALVALSLLILLPGLSQGRIFRRWRAADAPDTVMESSGGKAIYRANVHINGGKGTLAIFSFEEDLAGVSRALYEAFKAEALRSPSGGVVLAKLETATQHLSLVVLSTGPGQPTIVFTIAQSPAQAAQSKEPPRDPLPVLGLFPGAETVFYARDDEGRTGLALSEAHAAPEIIEAHYETQLTAEGWKLPLPVSGVAPLRIYQRPGELCAVFVTAGAGDAPARITLLHKQLGIE